MMSGILKRWLSMVVVPLGLLYVIPVPDGVPISPAPHIPILEYTGTLAPNEDLFKLSETLFVNHDFGGDYPILKGMESFASKGDYLYTGVHGGDVVKIDTKTMKVSKVIKIGKKCSGQHQELICGRPLGLEFNPEGDLIIADSSYGLYKYNEKSNKLTTLVPQTLEIDGKVNMLTNSIAIDKDGIIYYTVSSTNYHLSHGVLEIMTSPSGRVLKYDPASNQSTVLMDGIGFANGIVLSPKQDYFLVCETSYARVWKYYLTGSKRGQKEIFANLPGHTDNVKSNGKDGYIFGIISPFVPGKAHITTLTYDKVWLRKLLATLVGVIEKGLNLIGNELTDKIVYWIANTESGAKLAKPYGLLLDVDESGKITRSWHSTDGSIALICEGHIHTDGLMYLGSPYNNYLARMPYK